MITSYERGHEIVFDPLNGKWSSPESDNCKECGKPPTDEGYDACLGKIEGVKSACCGHGKTKPILMRG